MFYLYEKCISRLTFNEYVTHNQEIYAKLLTITISMFWDINYFFKMRI